MAPLQNLRKGTCCLEVHFIVVAEEIELYRDMCEKPT